MCTVPIKISNYPLSIFFSGSAPAPVWVGINFCHPVVVKLQQQCHMQNTIFDLPQTTGSIHFFLGEGEFQYPGDSNRRI